MSIDICHDVLWMCFEWSSSPRRRILHGMLPMRTRFLDHQLTGAFLARTVWRHSCSPTSPVWNVLRPFFRSALLAPWSKSSFSRMRSEGFPSFECVCVCHTLFLRVSSCPHFPRRQGGQACHIQPGPTKLGCDRGSTKGRFGVYLPIYPHAVTPLFHGLIHGSSCSSQKTGFPPHFSATCALHFSRASEEWTPCSHRDSFEV